MKALTFFDPNRFIDIKNKMLTFDGNNEKVFNNFCEIIGLQTDLIKEELINFSASYDMVSKSLEVTDEDDNLYKNQTMTDIPKYSPKPKKYKNSTCSKCMPCVMKLLYKYNFHTAAFTNLYLAYKFILTLSCTQVHCERSFSKLKIIKTRLRSSISQELLEPLLLISIESDKVPDLEEIISCYAHSSTELKKMLLIGDEVVVIVTSADQMCKKCTSLLTHMDKLENDLELVKNVMLSDIQKKYGILPPDQAVKDDNSEEQVEQVRQCKVPSGLTVGVSPAVTTAAVVMPVKTPSKLLKTQQLQQQQQPQQQEQPPQQEQPQQQLQQQQPTQQEIANRMKLYKCGFCIFQSKNLGHVRFHMRTHGNKKESEKPIATQQKRQIYRCQVCSATFDTRINCIDHIQKDHQNQLTQSTSNAIKETDESRPVTIMKPEPPQTQEDNQQVESPMDVDKNHWDNNKATVDIDMLLDDHVPTGGSANVEPEKEKENSLGDMTEKEVNSELKPEPAEEEEEDKKEDTAVLEQEETDQETSVIVKKEIVENNECGENGSDLDIESMLAAIHNDNSTN
ncbi:hypothetical protein QTP88_028795 [Uroleucon formosanum]